MCACNENVSLYIVKLDNICKTWQYFTDNLADNNTTDNNTKCVYFVILIAVLISEIIIIYFKEYLSV